MEQTTQENHISKTALTVRSENLSKDTSINEQSPLGVQADITKTVLSTHN